MRTGKNRMLLLLALLLCLVACGKEQETAGQDWCVSGVVVGSGTVIRNGEQVDVLVTVGEHGAAFYLDAPEQALFDSVSFPETLPDAQRSFQAVSFDDLDGDGDSDVQLSFFRENGDTAKLVWIWNSSEGYALAKEEKP